MLRALLLVSVLLASIAADFQQGEQCAIGTTRTISNTLYSVCQDLVIDGAVHGDVVALAGSVTINGTVDGDVTAITGQLVVHGILGGSIRAVAARLLIAPGARLTAPHGDVAALGLSAELHAPVSGDLLYAGYQTIVDGTLGGDVHFHGASLAINGQVEGKVGARTESEQTAVRLPDMPSLGLTFIHPGLSLGESARIRGDLRYSAPQQAPIRPGMVGGEIRFLQDPASSGTPADGIGVYAGHILRDLLVLMTVGLIVLLLGQRQLHAASRQLRSRTLASVGYGLLAIVLFFPAVPLLLIADVASLALAHVLTFGELTIAVTVLLLVVDLVLVGGFWFVVLFLARVVVCYVLGQWVGCRILPATDRASALVISLLIGVLAFAAIANLGVIGSILDAVMTITGLGAIVLYTRDRLAVV